MSNIPRDKQWVAESFMLGSKSIENSILLRRYRYTSSADFKFTGSGFGMNTVLNAPPQFTPLADPRRPGLWASDDIPIISKGAKKKYFQGQGVAYSEMLDDNKQIVHIRYGVTQYLGLISFYTGFYDNNSALLARQGRASIAYYVGLIGMTIGTLWLQPFIIAGRVWNYIIGRTSSRYMTLKPTMPLFWSRATVMVNTLGANLGIIPRVMENSSMFGGAADAFGTPANNGGGEFKNELEYMEYGSRSMSYKESLKRLMPDLMNSSYSLDFQRASTQAARLNLAWEDRISAMGNFPKTKEGLLDMMGYLQIPLRKGPNPPSLEEYIRIYHGSTVGSIAERYRDGDGIGDTLETIARSGDTAALDAVNQAAKAADADPSVGGGEVTPTADTTATNTTVPVTGDVAAAAAQNATNNKSSLVATPATETNPTPLTTVPLVYKDAAERNILAGDPTVSAAAGIDSAALRERIFGARESELYTTVRGVENPPTDEAARTALAAEQAGLQQGNTERSFYQVLTGWIDGAKEAFKVGTNNGYEFISFAVNYTGEGSMSLSNSTKETTISATLKSVSGTTRDSRIALSDFKTGFAFIDGVTRLIGDVFSGAMDAVSMSGMLALAGNAFIDFPKQWDDSQVTVPTANFTIELRSPYGTPMASFLNLYTVIAPWLAGAVPLSTGTQSYTAPFVCEAYCQGAFAIRYGMITNLTIRHGVGNLGYDGKRRPLAFNIDVEIADLSAVYHASISNGMSPLNIFKRVMDDDNAFTDYLCTISGMSLADMTNSYRKLSIRMAAQLQNTLTMFTPDYIVSNFVTGTAVSQTIRRIFGPTTIAGT